MGDSPADDAGEDGVVVSLDEIEADALAQAFVAAHAEEFDLFTVAWVAGKEYGEENREYVSADGARAETRVLELEDKLQVVEAAEKAAEDRAEAAEARLRARRKRLGEAV